MTHEEIIFAVGLALGFTLGVALQAVAPLFKVPRQRRWGKR